MRILVLCLLIMAVSGCTSMLVGGGTSGGYQRGSDERSSSTVTADSAITTAIKGKLAGDAALSSYLIGVRTSGGKVTLTGTVGNYAAREQVERITMATAGVKAVENRINVQTGR